MLVIILKLLGFILLTLLMVPLGLLCRISKNPRYVLRLSQRYFQLCSLVIGLRVSVKGEIQNQEPLLLVSNHISYLDILALGSAAPITFIPKSEISGWPFIGSLCRLIGCVFVDRRRSQTKQNMAAIHEGIAQGKALTLFAEGTTGSGKTMQTIRSSYFQLVEEFAGPLTIQPVYISYDRVHGLPMDESTRYRIAWVGDEELVPHLTELLTLGVIDVTVHFLPPINLSNCKTRKDIATACQMAFDHYRRTS